MGENAIEVISTGFRSIAQGGEFTRLISFLTQFIVFALLIFLLYYLIHIGNHYVDDRQKVNVGRKQLFFLVLGLFLFTLLLLLFQIRVLLMEILSPFIIAIVIAYILNPLIHYLQVKGIDRMWGVLLVYLFISCMILILSLTLVPRITEEVRNLMAFLPQYSNDSYEHLHNLYLRYNQNLESLPTEFESVKELLRLNIDRIQEIVFGIASSFTSTLLGLFSRLVNLVLIPILVFYFLKDAKGFKKAIILLIPRYLRKNVMHIAKDVDSVLGGFIRGQLIVAGFVGILTMISLLVLRVEFAVLVGLIAGIANIVPYFGPVVGIVPGVLFALLDGPIKAIWVVVVFTVIQQIESAILAPKIVGKSVGLHPVLVILALLVGGRFLGIVGLLIAVPVAGTIKVLGKHLISHVTKIS
ncbi:protein of unknown function UPF0118 [Alkaliphilus metalliredigens QYMF]|uniref:Sporulation integral membrane protein YtvI n=1 Tax=Alkaliphilus metalliredigens (strain QYMF) TaxID=293826 RepID=A6TQZ3_ALKMQ|nr:AI-2E family transporter [Alkaliphilus metalliredigens]ABR48611.1 protein of unknown function UPF0118 [Alkaliphilus metalliredigens QYMF]